MSCLPGTIVGAMSQRPEQRVWSASGTKAEPLPLVVSAVAVFGGIGLPAYAQSGSVATAVVLSSFVGLVIMIMVLGLEQSRRWDRASEHLEKGGLRTEAVVTRAGWEVSANLGDMWIAHYRYEVAGSAFEGSREFHGVKGATDPVRTGDRIVVLYDPESPQVSGWLEPALESFHRHVHFFSGRY